MYGNSGDDGRPKPNQISTYYTERKVRLQHKHM